MKGEGSALRQVLWLGPMASDRALRTRRATNQAAVRYSRGLLAGLRANGAEIHAVAHCCEQAFPKGAFWPGRREDFEADGLDAWLRYPNVKGLRDAWLTWRYAAVVRRLAARGSFDALLCYNVLHPYHVAAMRVAARAGVPCFPIVLDGDDPRRDGWRAILRQTRYAAGVIFVSRWAADHFPGSQPVLHMDGGCEAWFGDEAAAKTEPNLVVYTGGLDHWRGLDLLVDIVRHLPDPGCRFVICGRCDRAAIQARFHDPRVAVMGLVPDAELHDICCRARVFLNTRDPAIEENVLNFPSKIPNYLSYGKPVVSTWTASLDPEYRNVLCVVPDGTGESFAQQVRASLAWGPAERLAFRTRLREWVLRKRVWSRQTERMLAWMAARSGI